MKSKLLRRLRTMLDDVLVVAASFKAGWLEAKREAAMANDHASRCRERDCRICEEWRSR